MASVSLNVTNLKYDFNSYNAKRPKQYWVNKAIFLIFFCNMHILLKIFSSTAFSRLDSYSFEFCFLKTRDTCCFNRATQTRNKFDKRITTVLPERNFFRYIILELHLK